jgi:hypothetical protein
MLMPSPQAKRPREGANRHYIGQITLGSGGPSLDGVSLGLDNAGSGISPSTRIKAPLHCVGKTIRGTDYMTSRTLG